MAMLLAACASPPKFLAVQPKPAEGAGYVLARSPRLDETSHLVGHLDADKNIVYTQNFGGGGVGLGLLLGPVGVAANIGMIDSETKKDIASLYGRVDLKPAETFRRAALARGLPLALAAAPGAGRLTPYVLVTRIENDRVLIAAALLIEHGAPPQQWTGRYLVQLPERYDFAGFAKFGAEANAGLGASVLDGYEKMISFLGSETTETMARERPITFRSEFVSPRFNAELRGSLIADDGELVWIRTFGAVYALRKSNVTYTVNSA